MVTTDLLVTVNQDTSKRIRFGNSDFAHTIKLKFPIPDPNDPRPCYVAHGTDVEPDEQDKMEDELAGAEEITSGFFTVKVEGTENPKTGILVLEYTSANLESVTRIQYDDHDFPITVTEDKDGDTRTFNFSGTIWIWLLNEPGNTDDQVVACDNQNVKVILKQ